MSGKVAGLGVVTCLAEFHLVAGREVHVKQLKVMDLQTATGIAAASSLERCNLPGPPNQAGQA